MAHSSPSALHEFRREEDNLTRLVADSNLNPQQLEDSLARHRNLGINALLTDFEYATSPAFRAEERLWDNHQKVNTRFRSDLASLRKSSEQKPVELRKLRHEYLRFIKGAQTFYRNLVKRLDRTYGGIPSLQHVAKKLNPDVDSTNRKPSAKSNNVPELELCCHYILIRLGDLSRYRETELAGPDKNWGPAHGYYDLALTVCPESGIPYNQRAVIALADKTIFRALYYVYRSISASTSHPQGEQNLRRALQKVQQAWNSKELTVDPLATAGAALPRGMVAWYLRLLEMFFHGKTGQEREELEREVVTQLKVDLCQNPSKESPRKLVLTGLAAQHAAQERFELKQSTSYQNSYLFFLQLNLQIFTALLSVFATEAEHLQNAPSGHNPSIDCVGNTVTVTLGRTLPVLRLYGLWLEMTSSIIDSPASGLSDALKNEFWTSYAKTLSLMMAKFSLESLPTVEHLLEEDEDTIGFKPLSSPKNNHVWYHNERLKPRWYELTENERETEKEMKFRIREFTLQGLELTLHKRVPLVFEQERRVFAYQGESTFKLPHTSSPEVINTALSNSQSSDQVNGDGLANLEDMQIASVKGEAVQDQEAERMVDSIVGGKPEATDSSVLAGRESIDRAHRLTPPRGSISRNSGPGVASPLPSETQTVFDIMAATYKQPKPLSPAAQPLERQTSRSGSQPNSTGHSPALPQQALRYSSDLSLGASQGIARTQYTYPEDPALPGLGVIREKPARTPLLGSSSPQPARSSPLPPPPSHSRVSSRESGHGIWGAGIFDPSYHHSETEQDSNGMSTGQHTSKMTSSRVPDTFPGEIRSSPVAQHVPQFPQGHALHGDRDATPGNGSPITNTHTLDLNEPMPGVGQPRTENYANPWNGLHGRRFTEWHQT